MLGKWDQYNQITQRIATLLHPYAEVAVHDLEKQHIAILVNN